MSFRFRKTIRLLPGLRLNLSKSGVSASVGKAGATVNLSDKGVRGTVGLPGTGISYSERLATGEPATGGKTSRWLIVTLLLALGIAIAHFMLAR